LASLLFCSLHREVGNSLRLHFHQYLQFIPELSQHAALKHVAS
jgi:hypothetical protein